LIAYGASIYAIAMSNVPDFPYSTANAIQYIFYGTIGGLICAFTGMAIQHMVNRHLSAQEVPEIIETI
jgi:putative membrane protein